MQYRKAVDDASKVHADEIDTDLFAINDANGKLIWHEDKTKLLVVTWKSKQNFEQYLQHNTQTSSSEAYVTWVTAAPQLQTFCKHFLETHPQATPTQLELRLKKYLGLSYEWPYDVFVEMWVKPEDMFRPCVDPEINDSACALQFSGNPTVKNIADYQAFYKNLYFNDFRTDPGAPWTGLGYTFDWGGEQAKDVGASEYILVPSADYEIKAVYSTTEYCK